METYFSQIDRDTTLGTLDQQGFACIPNFFSPTHCDEFIRHYDDDQRYRSTINMAAKGYGNGQYRYFQYPLPDRLGSLRQQSYDFLLPLARKWAQALKEKTQYPDNHQQYLKKCHQAGQLRPTPLILQYREGGYNRLHQDLYGELVFPFQLIILLSKPRRDFTGGELVITEQRPRMQSRVHVLSPEQGDAVILAVHHRPGQGARGYHRINMRHGVSTLRKGARYTLGIILHDAQ